MVGCTTGKTGASSGHSLYNIFVRYIHIDRIINGIPKLCQRLIQNLSLWNGSWETIQYISIDTVFLANTVHQHTDGNPVWNQHTLIHIFLCFLAKICAIFDIGTENISGRDMGDCILFCNHLRLCSFARSRGTQHDNLHTCLHFTKTPMADATFTPFMASHSVQ